MERKLLIERTPAKFSKPFPKPPSGKVGGSLTLKQRRFIYFYLNDVNHCGYKAAEAAGYANGDVQATYLLQNPKVAAEIQRRIEEELEAAEVTPKRLLQELAVTAKANLLDYGWVDENGRFKVDLNRIKHIQGTAIQELKQDENGELTIRLFNKDAAIEKLGRYFKLWGTGAAGSSEKLSPDFLDSIVFTGDVTINQQVVNNPALPQETPPNQLEANNG